MLLSSRIEALYAWKGCIDDEVVAMLMKHIRETQNRKRCTFQVIGPDSINVEHDWASEATEGLSPEELIMAICAYKLALVPPADRVFAIVPKILADLSEGWTMPEGYGYASPNSGKTTAFERAIAFFPSVGDKDISLATVMDTVRVLERFASTLAGGIICPEDEARLFTRTGWLNHVAAKRDDQKKQLIAKGLFGKDLGEAIGNFVKTLKKPTLNPSEDALVTNSEALSLPASILAFCHAQRKKDEESEKRGDDAENEMQRMLKTTYHGMEFNKRDRKGREFDAVSPDGYTVECKATESGARHAFAKQQAALVSDENLCVAIFVPEIGFRRVTRGKDGIARLGPKIDVSEIF